MGTGGGESLKYWLGFLGKQDVDGNNLTKNVPLFSALAVWFEEDSVLQIILLSR